MSQAPTATKIWIGFGIAAAAAAVLGGLGAYAAAHQEPVWAAVAIALSAGAAVGLGAWIAAAVGGSARALAEEAGRVSQALARGDLAARAEAEALPPELRPAAEAMNGALERLARSCEVTTEALAQLGRGQLPAAATGRQAGDLPQIKAAVDGASAAVGALLDDMATLSAAAARGASDHHLAADRHPGRFGEVLRGLSDGCEKLIARGYWYEQILDAVPFPLSVTDKEMRWTFINAPVEKFLGVKRKDVVGKACENWNADICRTENCGVARLRKGQLTTRFTQAGMNFRVDTGYLKNPKGETVGHVEVVQDITLLTRVTEYQRDELGRLSRSLVQLASGDLDIDVQVGAGDEHTGEARQQFLATVGSLERLRQAIAALVRDVSGLVDAAATGNLSQRADASGHDGEFRKVVQGMNMTLDAVMSPIQEATQVLDALAQRDLKARVTGTFSGDHTRIKDSVNAAAEALHDALAQVSDAVEQVSSAATQIASSSQAVASGASEQAASLAETSSSIESVASMTKQSADHAQQANHLAGTARGAAGEGTAAVEQMQTAMSRIKASAEGTSQIIRDINDIAFQTNLLALNAAVEAARAGEAGRGFAVVAEEVRSLALRAKEAAMKTEELIRQSVKEAVQGEVTAKQVAGKLTEIAGGISKVTDIISEIAAGAKEQSSGIDHVNRAVGEMDKVTQQNAASAEESSSAASELSAQAEELASMIGSFQLERTASRAVRVARVVEAEEEAPAPPRPLRRPPAARLQAPRPSRDNGVAADPDKLFPMDDSADVRDF
jgi:methyl-accepting chemotaxis protein